MPNLQRYPVLFGAFPIMVMPVTGLTHGNGLYLLGADKHPEVAAALGFREAMCGFVYDPGRHDPDFRLSLAAVGGRVAAIIPAARFVMANLERLPVDVRFAGSDAYEGKLARLMVHRHITHCDVVSPPKPTQVDRDGALKAYRREHGADMASIIGRSVARAFPDLAVERSAMPFAYDLPDGGVVFGRVQGDAILVGIGEDASDDTRTMTLAVADDGRFGANYVVVDDRVVSSQRVSAVEARIKAWLEVAANELDAAAPRPF